MVYKLPQKVLLVSLDHTLREKCLYSELFWSALSHIRTEYEEILRISPYSVRMRENAVIFAEIFTDLAFLFKLATRFLSYVIYDTMKRLSFISPVFKLRRRHDSAT